MVALPLYRGWTRVRTPSAGTAATRSAIGTRALHLQQGSTGGIPTGRSPRTSAPLAIFLRCARRAAESANVDFIALLAPPAGQRCSARPRPFRGSAAPVSDYRAVSILLKFTGLFPKLLSA